MVGIIAEGADGASGNVESCAVAQKSSWGVLPACCADNVLPRHRPAMPTLGEMRASHHTPVVVTPDPSVKGPIYNGSADLTQQLPINTAGFECDSAFFEVGGCMPQQTGAGADSAQQHGTLQQGLMISF